MNQNKLLSRIKISQTIKVLIVVSALIVAYLFALNGRFIKQDTDEYFDKWTKTVITVERYDVIK